MKKALLILFVVYTGISYGQNTNETKIDLLPFDNQLFNNSMSQHSNPFLLSTPTLYGSIRDSLRLMDLQTDNSQVNFPAIAKETFTAPFISDGNLYNLYYINSHNWINTSRIQSNFIGLGGMTLFGASYNWKLGEFMIVSSGLYASKYNIYNNFRSDAGVNGNIKFVLSDRISMNLFGQYSAKGINNAVIPLVSALYPQSYYGGSFEFKVNDKWGLMVGANREFDVFSRKWITKPFVMPLFYFK
jgi:hypothetical protein